MKNLDLKVLVLSNEAQTQLYLRRTLENLQVEAVMVPDQETALRQIQGSVLDGFIVDWESCTDVRGLIQEWQSRMSQSKISQLTVITSSPESFTEAMRIAPLVCYRPSSYEQTLRALRPFHSFLIRHRRQSFRHQVDLPVELLYGKHRSSASILDLSETGAGISAELPVSVGDEIVVVLTLAAAKRKTTLRVRASVIWASPIKLMGVCFKFADFQQRSVLSNWLMQREQMGQQNGKAALELAMAG